MTKIEGVPDGYELVRFGSPSEGDLYLSLRGIVKVAAMNFVGDCRPIVRKIEPPKPIEPPEGYRLLTAGELIAESDLVLRDQQWKQVHVLSAGDIYDPACFHSMCRKITPQVRPMTRDEFLQAWKQRGFCPLIDPQDDYDIVLRVVIDDFADDQEIVYMNGEGWCSFCELSNYKFASDNSPLTVEE